MKKFLSIVRWCNMLPKETQVIKKKGETIVFMGEWEAEKSHMSTEISTSQI